MVGKKLRFSVFERDSFTCQYCGRKPPVVILHIDHLVSQKDGGGDEEANLITSCADCNLGKSSKSIPRSKLGKNGYKQELDELREKTEQLQAYYAYCRKKAEYATDELNVFQDAWYDASCGEEYLTDKGLRDMKKLSRRYPFDMIFDAIQVAWEKDYVAPKHKFKYMCGVLKHMNAQRNDPDLPSTAYGN